MGHGEIHFYFVTVQSLGCFLSYAFGLSYEKEILALTSAVEETGTEFLV